MMQTCWTPDEITAHVALGQVACDLPHKGLKQAQPGPKINQEDQHISGTIDSQTKRDALCQNRTSDLIIAYLGNTSDTLYH
jgi:hypothetical protein